MDEKKPRPHGSITSQRAAGSEELFGGASNPQNSLSRKSQQEQTSTTLDRYKLAEALRFGATLWIGRQHDSCINLHKIKEILQGAFPFDDDHRHCALVVPFLYCWHWFSFTQRQYDFSRKYPLTFLRELITTCFGLSYSDIPMDAILAALVTRGFKVERVHPRDSRIFNWVTNIRRVSYLGYDSHGFLKEVPLSALGQRGALPAIKITRGPQ